MDANRRSARRAGLRYVSDSDAGIARVKRGRGFVYLSPQGRVIRSAGILKRIEGLVIPPAWTEVWICRDPRGHLQATGRDERGRKQFLYHPRWQEVRDAAKFDRLRDFARRLPRLRRRVQRDLRCKGLPRDKVLAAVVAIMEKTLIRVGNDQYAKENGHFGLTTLRDRHVRIKRGGRAVFNFVGKSGVKREIDLEDAQLTKIVRRCQELPGEELFQYVDEAGEVVDVGSGDVNEYLREATGEGFTAKDFRTWAGTVAAAVLLSETELPQSKTDGKKKVAAVVRQVSERLGNTQAVCRKCYIHPRVLKTYLEGKKPAPSGAAPIAGLHQDERTTLALLESSSR